MTTDGFVLLHRKLLNSPLWTQLPEAWLKVWIAILLRANFRPSKWWDGTKEIDLPAGSFVTSIEKLASLANVSIKQIRGTLNYLEATGSVARVTASRYSIITITNWDTYQHPSEIEGKLDGRPNGKQSAALAANRGQTEGKQRATEEQSNKETTLFPVVEDLPSGKAETSLNRRLTFVSREIHDRHPKPRRDIGIGAVAKMLRTICSKGSEAERIEQLEGINRRHAGWCASPAWIKDGGEFAKGLENWLAPTMGRFNAEPVAATDNTGGTQYTRVQ